MATHFRLVTFAIADLLPDQICVAIVNQVPSTTHIEEVIQVDVSSTDIDVAVGA